MQAPEQRRSHQELRDPRAVPPDAVPPEAVPPAAGRNCRISLVPTAESARTARDFTIATLRGWYLDTLIPDTVLVVSELVTNAIRHGTACPAGNADDARVELSWCCLAGRLICMVTDRSVRPPVLEPADPGAESGRGLQVVHALTIAWGWTALSTQGKTVWAAFPLPGTLGCAHREALLRPASDPAATTALSVAPVWSDCPI